MRQPPFPRLIALVFCCQLLLAGCAGKLPKTMPLDPAEEQEAAALWSGFVASKRPDAVDADIRLQWDVLGNKGGVGGSLQVQRPALLRFAAIDPLGRPLILAVADASSFTLVDNRAGHAYRGAVQAKFWRSYVPAAVAPQDLLPLLGGFLSQDAAAQLITPARDAANQGFWYQWRDAQAISHHVLLDRQSGTMTEHLLIDTQGDLLLALSYSGYRKAGKNGIAWPAQMRITGKTVAGTLALQFEQIYSHGPQRADTFLLTPPPHFTVEQVD